MANHNKPWNYGQLSPKLAPTEHPTTKDIAWAAGIFEGEGTCSAPRKYMPEDTKRGGTVVMVSQKERWILDRLRALFGGRVREYRARAHKYTNEYRMYHRWDLHGARARGFLMTIWLFLSPRRRLQAQAAWEG